jgi:hypothetical protein
MLDENQPWPSKRLVAAVDQDILVNPLGIPHAQYRHELTELARDVNNQSNAEASREPNAAVRTKGIN